MLRGVGLFLAVAAARLRRAPVTLLEDVVAVPDNLPDCPPVHVDTDHSSVLVSHPTFVTELYESVGPCDDSSEAAQKPFHYRAIFRKDDDWIGSIGLPRTEHATHLCSVGEGCVGDLEGIPNEPELQQLGSAYWVPLKIQWPLRVLHYGMVVFAVVALIYTMILAATATRPFHWFPPERQIDPPVQLPPTYELLGEVALSLAKMLMATATLWIVLFVFVVRRSLTPFHVAVLLGLPLLLLLVHCAVVLWNMHRKALYYSLFAQGIHLNFPERKLLLDHWLAVAVLMTLFLYSCVGALWGETAAPTWQGRVLLLTMKLVSVITPLGYSFMFLWQDDQFIWKLRPLHELMARHEEGHVQSETTKFIHELAPIDEDKFLAAGGKLAIGSTTTLVEPEMIMAMEGLEDLEELSRYDTLMTLRWSIPIAFSHNLMRFRLALTLASLAIASVVLMLGGMLSYYMHLYPTLQSVEIMNGHLQPPFQPHIFEYTILVDKAVKGDTIDVVPNPDVTAEYIVYDNRGMETHYDLLEGGLGNVYIPYLRSSSSGSQHDADGDEFLEAQEHPVTFYIDANGAGTTQTYTFTAVKTHTMVTQLSYSFTASGENVTIVKNLQEHTLIATAEGGGEETEPSELEDIDVYVPPTTENVNISLATEMILYGPKHRVIDPDEFDWLEAGASLHLCPPEAEHCKQSKEEQIATQALDGGVVAVPIVLSAKGGETSTFTVSLVRVQNRLIDFDIHKFVPGEEGWKPLVMVPPFDPLHLFYEVFFDDPIDGISDMFLRMTPAGDPGVNHVRMEMDTPEGLALVPFCRHPEEYMIAERDEELDCVVDPNALQIKSPDGQEFKGHVLARLEMQKKSQPFEVRMRIVAEQNVTQDRIYTFRFLPQEPMRLVLRLPSGLPAVLQPPFRSDVLNYSAVVPLTANEVTVEMAPTSSFWATTDLKSLNAGSSGRMRNGVQQVIPIKKPCQRQLTRPTNFPGEVPGDDVDRSLAEELAESTNASARVKSDAVLKTDVELCPVEIEAFERKADFPRVFHVELFPAAPGTITYIGPTDRAALPAFSPSVRAFQTVIPIEGATPSLLVSPAVGGISAAWNGRPLKVAVDGPTARVQLGPVRKEVCACQRLTGCAEKLGEGAGQRDPLNGCELVLRRGEGAPYTISVREGATAMRIEAVVEE